MKEIIKKAIEGGYKNPLMRRENLYDSDLKVCGWGAAYTITGSEMTLDPKFFQALGKACGWKKWYCSWCEETYDRVGMIACQECGKEGAHESWLAYALEFTRINLTEDWNKAVEYLVSVTK